MIEGIFKADSKWNGFSIWTTSEGRYQLSLKRKADTNAFNTHLFDSYGDLEAFLIDNFAKYDDLA